MLSLAAQKILTVFTWPWIRIWPTTRTSTFGNAGVTWLAAGQGLNSSQAPPCVAALINPDGCKHNLACHLPRCGFVRRSAGATDGTFQEWVQHSLYLLSSGPPDARWPDLASLPDGGAEEMSMQWGLSREGSLLQQNIPAGQLDVFLGCRIISCNEVSASPGMGSWA